MKNNSYFKYFTIFVVVSLSCTVGTQGVKKMRKETWPVNPIEINFKDRIISIFPVLLNHSFGMVAGKPDHESLRIGMIAGNKVKENVVPRGAFEVADETGTCIGENCTEMYMSSRRILSVVDWASKKLVIDYWGVGDVLQNTYLKTKIISGDEKKVLTIMVPFYNSTYDTAVNGTASLTIDDLIQKKRVKSIPISTESGKYKEIDRTLFGTDPTFAFGPTYVIYRESYEYRWLAVNNDLDYIEHPLKDTLNEYKEYFGTDLVSMEISPDQPCAIAICQREIGKSHFVAIIQWNKAPAVMPVGLSLHKDEDIEYNSLILSPSGRWAYFNTSGGPVGSRHFLLYIDLSLPGGCLPPFELNVEGFDNKATWITKPEGFVMQVGDKMLYWDLSKFDPRECPDRISSTEK
jgi:hypothetical protein